MICPKCKEFVDPRRITCPFCGEKMPTVKTSPAPSAQSPIKTSSAPNNSQINNAFSQMLESHKPWFNFIERLPLIIAILVAIGGSILSIAMGSPAIMLVFIIGSPIIYCIMRLSLTPIIIQTECLMKLAEEANKKR